MITSKGARLWKTEASVADVDGDPVAVARLGQVVARRVGELQDAARPFRRSHLSRPVRPPGSRSPFPRRAGGSQGRAPASRADEADHVRLRDELPAADLDGPSAYARDRSASWTNSSRGTVSIAASTSSSVIPRLRSWRSTIRRRLAAGSRMKRERGTRGRRLEAEMSPRDAGQVGDRRRRGKRIALEAGCEHGHDRVAREERPVATATGMVATPEIGELEALLRGDQHLPRPGRRARQARPSPSG